MAVVLLTFTIGILNLCLGYALAVFLGCGPPSLWDGWDALLADAPVGSNRSDFAGGSQLEAVQSPELRAEYREVTM